VLHEADGPREITLLATGTEVGLAVQAREALAEKGNQAAVVSMPCWEIFAEQDQAYRKAVLGDAPRIGVEAAMPFGWERWLRPTDRFVGMSGCGASDHAATLQDHFGIPAKRIVAEAMEMMLRVDKAAQGDRGACLCPLGANCTVKPAPR
jgi:transketolase